MCPPHVVACENSLGLLGKLLGEVPQSVLFPAKLGEIVCDGGEDYFLHIDLISGLSGNLAWLWA